MSDETKTGVHKVVHQATRKGTIAKWAAVNSGINTAIILTLVLTDSADRAAVAQQLPAFIDAIAAKMPVLISLASGIGLMVAAFRKHAYDERATDRS